MVSENVVYLITAVCLSVFLYYQKSQKERSIETPQDAAIRSIVPSAGLTFLVWYIIKSKTEDQFPMSSTPFSNV